MKDNLGTNTSSKSNLSKDKTCFENIYTKFKVSLFSLLYILLKNQNTNFLIECVYLVLQLLQLLAFPFNQNFANIWKRNDIFFQISGFLQNFQIVSLLKNNSEMYMIAFYSGILFVIIVITLITYVSIAMSQNKLNVLWPLRFLSYIIYFKVSVMLLPLLALFISIFSCYTPDASTPDNQSYVNTYGPFVTCWSGTYYLHGTFAIVISVLLIGLSFIMQATYFETKSTANYITAKESPKGDVVLLFNKIVFLLIFAFVSLDNQWVMILILFFLSISLFLIYFIDRPYYNNKMMKLFLVASGIQFWSYFVLLLGKILEFSEFDGCIPLFFIGVLFIFMIMLTLNKNKMQLLLININKFNSGEMVQKQIRYYLDLVKKKDIDRDSLVMLKGYIFYYEQSCTIPDCSLKKYIISLNNNMDSLMFLYQHAESLYQNGISKFPKCLPLRLSYILFLYEIMNKKQLVNQELIACEKFDPSFENQFVIYRYKRIIEEQTTDVNNDNMDIVSNITYKNNLMQFKNSILKVAILYIDFWSILSNRNQESQEDLVKLNEYGSKINSLVEEINLLFKKMENSGFIDHYSIKLYSDFLSEVLNDKERSNMLKLKLREIENRKPPSDENNLLNVDLTALAKDDEYQYIVISAQPENLGVITKITLGICSIFGYTRSELVGKSYEDIMPEIFHRGHKVVLHERINEYRKANLNSASAYKPSFKDIVTFGRNKSRYLVPISFKVALIPNEKEETVFIAKLWQDYYNLTALNTEQTCFILTNTSFIIQNFTGNAVNLLGMGGNTLNGTVEITSYIKQFHEEILKSTPNYEALSLEQKMKLKRQIVMSKFKTSQPIIWKKFLDMKSDSSTKLRSGKMMSGNMRYDVNILNTKSNKDLTKVSSNYLKLEKATDETFNLTTNELYMAGKLAGFIFKFETTKDLHKTTESSLFETISIKNNNNNATIIRNESLLSHEKINSDPPLKLGHKKRKSKKIFERPTSEGILSIDKNFLPNHASSFHIDLKKLTYIVNDQTNDLKVITKNEALEKFKHTQEKIESIEEVESSEYSDYDDSDYTENSEFTDQSKNYEGRDAFSKNQTDEFHKVDMTSIKYLMFDFKSYGLVEISSWNKESQVELKMSEDYQRKEEEEMTKNVIDMNQTTKQSNDKTEEEFIDYKEEILVKQIQKALEKEEIQPTITRLKGFSFIVFLIIFGLSFVFLIFFIKSTSILNEITKQIFNSYELARQTVHGVYHGREIELLSNPRYTAYLGDKVTYMNNQTDTIIELFTKINNYSSSILTTSLPSNIYNTTVLTHSINNKFEIVDYDVKTSVALVENNIAMFKLGKNSTNFTKVMGIYKDKFYFMHNSVNEIFFEILNFGTQFVQLLQLNVEEINYSFLILFVSSIVVLIGPYFLIQYAYLEVSRRKESYLEVFFEIGTPVIKAALDKCEKFAKKSQNENTSEMMETESEMMEESLILNKPNAGMMKKVTSIKKTKTSASSSEDLKVKFLINFGFILVIIVFCLIYVLYQSCLRTYSSYLDLFRVDSLEQLQYLMLLNSLREFMFEPNSIIGGKPASTYVESNLEMIYDNRFYSNDNTTTKEADYPYDYAAFRNRIYSENVCEYVGDLFTTWLPNGKCEHFASNTSNFGLDIITTNYIEDLRYLKKIYDRNNEKILANGFIYNNTLIGTDFEISFNINWGNKTLYEALDPFLIFNQDLHRNISIVNRFFLRPAFEALSQNFRTSIKSNLELTQLIFIIAFVILFLSIMIVYLIIWRPFQNKLKQEIYKTKNMLSIIPKEVLASLTHIHKLLDIGNNTKARKRKD